MIDVSSIVTSTGALQEHGHIAPPSGTLRHDIVPTSMPVFLIGRNLFTVRDQIFFSAEFYI